MVLDVRLRSLAVSPQERGRHQRGIPRLRDVLSDDESENCVSNVRRNTEEEGSLLREMTVV